MSGRAAMSQCLIEVIVQQLEPKFVDYRLHRKVELAIMAKEPS
jgi:hypothetical protein